MSESRMSLSRAKNITHGAPADTWDTTEAAHTITAIGDVLDRVQAEIQQIRAEHPSRHAHEWGEAAGRTAALMQTQEWLEEALEVSE